MFTVVKTNRYIIKSYIAYITRKPKSKFVSGLSKIDGHEMKKTPFRHRNRRKKDEQGEIMEKFSDEWKCGCKYIKDEVTKKWNPVQQCPCHTPRSLRNKNIRADLGLDKRVSGDIMTKEDAERIFKEANPELTEQEKVVEKCAIGSELARALKEIKKDGEK